MNHTYFMTAWLKVIRYQSTSFAYSLIVNRKKQNDPATNDERRTKNPRGFTLIELMVAISIIAILAAVGLVAYSSAQKAGRISKRVQDLNAIKTALELFKSSNGFYPSITAASTPLCLELLSTNNSLAPNYMAAIPQDPIQSGTSRCYIYMSNGVGTSPTATAYKVWVNVPSTEMSSADFAQQPALVDPDKDGTPDDSCVITPADATAWAIYTTPTACNYYP